MSTILIELPYEEIKKSDIAPRDLVRTMKDKISSHRQTFKIKLDAIEFRSGFNKRRKYNKIEELAASIKANGIVTPLHVDILKNGKIYVERGHRRIMALLFLKDQFESEGQLEQFLNRFVYVECFVNSTDTTELDRIKGFRTSNEFEPFSPVENADIVMMLKDHYGMSHHEIAKDLGISRQSVDNYAKISVLPDDIKQSLSDGNMSLNEALRSAKRLKDANDSIDDIQQETSAKGTNVKNSAPSNGPRLSDIGDNEEIDDERKSAQAEKEDSKLDTTSAEVMMMQESIQMVDKLTVMIERLFDTHPQFVGDANKLMVAIQYRLETTKNYLIKTQK